MTSHKIRAAAALLLAGICSGAEPSRDSQQDRVDKATFEAVCGSCHGAYMDTDLRSAAEWSETIDQMITIGAKGTKQQFDRVQRFLLSSYTRIGINSASAVQIAPVLGISETDAQSVVRYRDSHGPFRTLADLKKVPGIDPAKIDARKERISF